MVSVSFLTKGFFQKLFASSYYRIALFVFFFFLLGYFLIEMPEEIFVRITF